MGCIIRLYCLLLAVCLTPACAATLGIARQELEAFYGLYGRRVPGVALYSATVCSDAPVTIPEGRIGILVLERGVSIVDRGLIDPVGMRAHRRSRKYKAAEVAKWAGFLGASLTAGGVVSASRGVAIAFPLIAQLADRLSGQWASESVPPVGITDRWLDPAATLAVPAGGCRSLLFLGSYRRDIVTFVAAID
jgi:hypothetical protein